MFTHDFTSDRTVLEAEYGNYEFDAGSGEAHDVLCRVSGVFSDPSLPFPIAKARVMAHILTHGRLIICKKGIFADRIEGYDILFSEYAKRVDHVNSVIFPNGSDAQFARDAQYIIAYADYSHTMPEWDEIFALGIPGLLKRLNDARKTHENDGTMTDGMRVFYEASQTVLEAFTIYIGRLADEAKKLADGADEDTKKRMAFLEGNLRTLQNGAPQTFAECLQLIFLVYYVQQVLEGENLRSFGRFDKLLCKYYLRDIKNGIASEETQREIIRYFLIKCGAIRFSANIAITLCGLDENGNDVTNELTYALLEEYDSLNIYDPKFQIRFNDKLPEKLLQRIVKSIREGRNSYVLMNDRVIETALIKLGMDEQDVREYVGIGCYESTARGELPRTCAGRINLPKVVEYAINGGADMLTGKRIGAETPKDFEDFDAFYEAVKVQIQYACETCIGLLNRIEGGYDSYLNPSPFFSAATKHCVTTGKDIYDGGAKYTNTSVNLCSLGSAVDAIAAVKALVFEQKRVTMDELRTILAHDWEGYEELRQIALKCPKFGCGDIEADEIAKDFAAFGASCVNGKQNAKGGIYRCGFFTIDWRFDMGKHTPATADGRKAHAPLSKNMCASDGVNKRGVTALIKSSNAVDMTDSPNGTVLDLALHQSAVSGEDGIGAMEGLIKAFMASGGYAVHVNVLSADVLKDAKVHPEDHRDLQIRVCGWNAAFVNLSPVEQDGFIAQAEEA